MSQNKEFADVKPQAVIRAEVKKKTEMKPFDKAVRVVTAPPFMGALLLTLIFCFGKGSFGHVYQYITALVFLCVLPLLGYPLQKVVPFFKDKGRDGQRNLAIITANAGYILGIVFAFATAAPFLVTALYLTYFFSGLLIILFNKGLNIKASGHACGISGPVAFLFYVFGFPALSGLAVIALVYISSLKMGRHTLSELTVGSVLPVIALAASLLILGM